MHRKLLLWLVTGGIVAVVLVLTVLFFLFHQGDNAPTVEFPVRMSVGNTPGRDTITVTILVENTSVLPEQAHIVQRLPTSATVKANAGGKSQNNSLVWDVFLPPHTPPSVYQIELALGASTTATSRIPGTQATFSLPLVGFLINSTFTTKDTALPTLKTVTFDGGVLPESARAGSLLSLPVSLTNNSATTVTTSMVQVSIEDLASGKVVKSLEQTVTVQPGEHKKLILSLPAPTEPGFYIVTEKATGSTYAPSGMFEVTAR